MNDNKKLKIILVGGAFSPNKGAGAMTHVSIDLIDAIAKKNNRDYEVFMFSDFINEDRKYLLNSKVTLIDETKGLFNNSTINKVLEFSLSFFGILGNPFRQALSKFYNLKYYIDSDLLLDVSGDANSDGYAKGVAVTMRRLAIAINLKTPSIILPQSLGPYRKTSSNLLTKFYFPKMSKIYYREDLTKKILETYKLSNTEYSPDLAFALRPQNYEINVKSEWTNSPKKTIGISVSQSINRYAQLYSGPSTAPNYQEILCDFIRKYSKEYKFMFINHVLGPADKNDDRIMAKEIINKLSDEVKNSVINIDEDLDAKKLKHLIGTCDFFIGSRMHSNIAALSTNIPPIAIAYSHKFNGIMSLFDLSKYVIEYNDLSLDSLSNLFEELVTNKQQVIEDLQRTNKEFDKKYDQLVAEIEEFLI